MVLLVSGNLKDPAVKAMLPYIADFRPCDWATAPIALKPSNSTVAIVGVLFKPSIVLGNADNANHYLSDGQFLTSRFL